MSNKILHDFVSNEEGLAHFNGQVTTAELGKDDAETANRIAAAGLGEDVAGADALAAKSLTEFQRDTEFVDLAQVQATQQGVANDVQHQFMGRVQQRFSGV